MTQLWDRAIDATRDPAFGLQESYFVTPAAFNALGQMAFASQNLRELVQRTGRYFHLITEGAALEFEASDDPGPRGLGARDQSLPAAGDGFVALFVRVMRFVHGDKLGLGRHWRGGS